MKKGMLLIGFTMLFLCSTLNSLEIDKTELQNANKITFQSFCGVYKEDLDTALDIRKVGRRLGQDIWLQDTDLQIAEPTAYDNPKNRYSVKRIHNSENRGADIFIIENNAKVDTEINLRRILSGYIEYAFKLNIEDSNYFAELVCNYNASHYDDNQYFIDRYSNLVITSFSNKVNNHIGISTNYSEWPGNTKIIIPLQFSDINTSQIVTVNTGIQNSNETGGIKTEQTKNTNFTFLKTILKILLFILSIIIILLLALIIILLLILIGFAIAFIAKNGFVVFFGILKNVTSILKMLKIKPFNLLKIKCLIRMLCAVFRDAIKEPKQKDKELIHHVLGRYTIRAYRNRKKDVSYIYQKNNGYGVTAKGEISKESKFRKLIGIFFTYTNGNPDLDKYSYKTTGKLTMLRPVNNRSVNYMQGIFSLLDQEGKLSNKNPIYYQKKLLNAYIEWVSTDKERALKSGGKIGSEVIDKYFKGKDKEVFDECVRRNKEMEDLGYTVHELENEVLLVKTVVHNFLTHGGIISYISGLTKIIVHCTTNISCKECYRRKT